MNLKLLGDTAVELPEIGLGTWEYKGGAEPIEAALRSGHVLIDTAESYGTEEVVGQAVRNSRQNAFIATKVSTIHFRYSDVLKAADASLRRLRTEYIDLYQLHGPNAAVSLSDTMAAMEALVDAGKIRFIGVSNYSVHQMKEAQRCLVNHRIASNQIHYGLAERRADYGLLSWCQKEHITVLAYSPLERGLQNLRQRDRHGALRKVSEETGKTEAQVALNWCISKPGVIAIPKSNSLARIMENYAASGWTLSPEQIALLERSISSIGRIEARLRYTVRRILPRRYPPVAVA